MRGPPSIRMEVNELPKMKDMLDSGLREGTERIRAQFRDAAGQDNSPEGYGGDKIEAGTRAISDHAMRTVRDAGGAVKDKAMQHLKDRAADRIREREPVDDTSSAQCRESTSQTNDSYAHDSGSIQAEPSTEPDSSTRAPRQRPESGNRIKTKNEYIRSQGQNPTAPKEMHKAPSERYQEALGNKTAAEPMNSTGSPTLAQPEGRAPTPRTSSSSAHSSTPKAGNMGQSTNAGSPSRSAHYAHSSRQVYITSTRIAAQNAGRKSIKTLERGAVKTARKTAVKTVGRSTKAAVKTADKSVKVAERTVRTSAQAAQKTAQITARAAQAAARAAQVAAKASVVAAKAIAKATAAVIKALIAAVKALVAAIAAGGWVVIVIIMAIALVAVILCACFGVFASNEEDHPMTAAIQEIDTEFRESIDAEIARLSTGDYDEISIKYSGDMDGDSDYLTRWNDVIAIYAVRTTMDDTNPMDVVEVTPEKIEKLREVFNDMNSVEYEIEVIETEGAGVQVGDEDTQEAEIHRKLIITVTVTSMDYLAGADYYSFSDEQREALAAMMEPQMLPMYAALIGIDLMGGYEGSLTDIISGLPAGEKGTVIVDAALSRLGHPYSQDLRGEGNYVDCSYLVQWAYAQAGISIPGTSVAQAQYCADRELNVDRSELQPGDLVFWSKITCDCGRWNEIHHVGIYVTDNMVVEASSSKGRVIMRELWGLENGAWQVHSFGRPT